MGNKHPKRPEKLLDDRLWRSASFWEEDSKVYLQQVSHHGLLGYITCMGFNHSRKILGIASSHGTIQFHGKPGIIASVQSNADDPYVHSLCFSQHSSDVLTVTADSSLEHWDISKVEEGEDDEGISRALVKKIDFKAIYKQEVSVCEVLTSFQSRFVFIGTHLGSVFTYDFVSKGMSNFKLLCPESFGKVSVNAIGFPPKDSEYALIAYSNAQIVLWDLKQQKIEKTISLNSSMVPRCLSFHPNGTKFIVGTQCGSLSLFDLTDQVQLQSIQSEEGLDSIRHIEWVKPCHDFEDGVVYLSKGRHGFQVRDGSDLSNVIETLSVSSIPVSHMSVAFPPSESLLRFKQQSHDFPHMVIADEVGNVFYVKPEYENAVSGEGASVVPYIENAALWRQFDVFPDNVTEIEKFIDIVMEWRFFFKVHDLPEHLDLLGNWMMGAGDINRNDTCALVASLLEDSSMITFWRLSETDLIYLFAFEISHSVFSSLPDGTVITCFQVSIESSEIVVGCSSGDVLLLQLRSPSEFNDNAIPKPLTVVSSATTHVSPVRSLCYDAKLERLAIADEDGVVSLYDTVNHRFLVYDSSSEEKNVQISYLHYGPSPRHAVDDTTALYVGLEDGRIKLYDLFSGSTGDCLFTDPFVSFIQCVQQIGRPTPFILSPPHPSTESDLDTLSDTSGRQSQSFLIVQSDSTVEIFDCDSKSVHKIQLEGKGLTAQIVSLEPFEDALHYALVVVDDTRNIYFISLTDLRLIYQALLPMTLVRDRNVVKVSRRGDVFLTTKEGELICYEFFDRLKGRTRTKLWNDVSKTEAMFYPASAAVGETRKLKKSKSVFKKIIASMQTPLFDQMASPEPILSPSHDQRLSALPDVQRTSDTVQRSVQQAQRNVDKAKEVENKSEALMNHSADFLKTAKALKEQQKNWF